MNKRFATPLLGAAAAALVLGAAHSGWADETPSCIATASCSLDEIAAISDDELGGMRGGDTNVVIVDDSEGNAIVDSYNTTTVAHNESDAENNSSFGDVGDTGNVSISDHSQAYMHGVIGQIANTGHGNNLGVQNSVSITFK